MESAEDYIRKKIREKLELKGEMNGLWTYSINGEDAMRWAYQFAEIQVRKEKEKYEAEALPMLGVISPFDVEPHECKYCGILTRQPDEVCYKNPNKSNGL